MRPLLIVLLSLLFTGVRGQQAIDHVELYEKIIEVLNQDMRNDAHVPLPLRKEQTLDISICSKIELPTSTSTNYFSKEYENGFAKEVLGSIEQYEIIDISRLTSKQFNDKKLHHCRTEFSSYTSLKEIGNYFRETRLFIMPLSDIYYLEEKYVVFVVAIFFIEDIPLHYSISKAYQFEIKEETILLTKAYTYLGYTMEWKKHLVIEKKF